MCRRVGCHMASSRVVLMHLELLLEQDFSLPVASRASDLEPRAVWFPCGVERLAEAPLFFLLPYIGFHFAAFLRVPYLVLVDPIMSAR